MNHVRTNIVGGVHNLTAMVSDEATARALVALLIAEEIGSAYRYTDDGATFVVVNILAHRKSALDKANVLLGHADSFAAFFRAAQYDGGER
jgi:hypothetical protein